MMFELIASYEDIEQEKIGGPFVSRFSEEVVALFTSRTLAKLYIQKSKLKNPIRQTWASTRVFRQNSLLRGAAVAFVAEQVATVNPPIDPVL